MNIYYRYYRYYILLLYIIIVLLYYYSIMNFLNMFSDEAPIFNNGYRSSLYTDPSIAQGINFLMILP